MSATGGNSNMSKDDLVKVIRDANAQASLKAFIANLHEVCFEKCIPSPAASMSRNEEACISNCVRKYMSLHDTVGKEWNTNIQKLQASAIQR